MRFIVDQLFIGNNRRRKNSNLGWKCDIVTSDRRSSCFVRAGNITPRSRRSIDCDLYKDVDEIRSYGQTIVYTVHESVGLAYSFRQVSRKSGDEFSSNIDLIDTLPPGLYEAIFESRPDMVNPDLLTATG